MINIIKKIIENTIYIIKEIWGFDKKLVIIIICSIPVAVILSVLDLYSPAIIIGALKNSTKVKDLVLIILALLSIKNIMYLFNNYINSIKNVSEHKMVLHFISILAEKKMDVDYDSLESPEIKLKAEKANQATSSNHTDAMQIQNTIASLCTNLLKFVIYSGVLCMLNPIIILVLLITAGLEYITIICIDSYENKTKDKRVQVSRKLWYVANISDNYSAAKDIRLFGLKGWLSNLSNIYLKEHKSIFNKLAKRKILFSLLDLLIILLRDGLAYWYLFSKIFSGELSVGEFVLYFSAISQFVEILGNVVFSFEGIQKASYQITDIREYLGLKNKFNRNKGPDIPKGNTIIELKNVSFKYPNSDDYILHNLNLKIHENENIALVGMNGAGKTTLIKILTGMYVPTEGYITINNIPINDYNRDEYYKLFSAVFQKISILPVSIADNITIGKTEEDKLHSCIHNAGITKMISSLKNGYNTLLNKEINYDATELSGGEKQKLMLARALYKNGPIFVLDEPTAALDPIAECIIYEKYNSFTNNKSSIFISHRLASTKFCDKIVLLEDGVVAEYGSHDELMEKGGKYAKMYEIQSQYYR